MKIIDKLLKLFITKKKNTIKMKTLALLTVALITVFGITAYMTMDTSSTALQADKLQESIVESKLIDIRELYTYKKIFLIKDY